MFHFRTKMEEHPKQNWQLCMPLPEQILHREERFWLDSRLRVTNETESRIWKGEKIQESTDQWIFSVKPLGEFYLSHVGIFSCKFYIKWFLTVIFTYADFNCLHTNTILLVFMHAIHFTVFVLIRHINV